MRYGWGDLKNFDDVLAATRVRAQNRRNFDVERISDLGIEYVDQGKHPRLPEGGFVASKLKDAKGNAMVVGPGAIRGACKLMDVKPNFFNGFEDRNAFPKALANKLDNPNRSGRDRTFKIRTGFADNGIDEQLAAILPGSYQIRDANEQLSHFAQVVFENLGPIKGVEVAEQGFGDIVSYRMVIGENIQRGQRDEEGQFMMFCLRMSETGLVNDEAALGLYRLICKNGAMGWDEAAVASWSHKTPLEDYLNKAGSTVRMATHFGQAWGKIFGDMEQAKLPAPAADCLHAMKASKMITGQHFDMADLHAKSGMEASNTQYDLYNLLTRGAQDLPNIQQRQSAERTTLEIFTKDGGFLQRLDDAAKRAEQAARRQTGEAGPGAIGTRGHERPQPALAAQLRNLMGD